LSSSKSSAKIIVKSLILIIILSSVLFPQQDTTVSNDADTNFVMSKSPWLAVLQSAVVPGLGQIYNESYIKAPIIWGAAALLVYGWIYNDDLYDEYRLLYLQTENSRHRTIRDFYRDQRDLFTIYMGLLYLLNLVDAYVDAHLFDFNVEEDFFTKTPMLNLRINF
jgi:hypothetical protein